MPFFPKLLAWAPADGTALTNTTTGASIIPASAKWLIPGGAIYMVGQMLRLRASGRVSTLTASPGTLTFEFRLGPTSAIIAATSPAFTLNTTAKTNVTWTLEWNFRVATIGASTSATLLHTGFWQSEAVVGSPAPGTGGSGQLMIPASAPAAGTGFDSTIDNQSDLQAKWSVANAANSIQVHEYELWDLTPAPG